MSHSGASLLAYDCFYQTTTLTDLPNELVKVILGYLKCPKDFCSGEDKMCLKANA